MVSFEMKAHEYRQLVNDLRDIAKQFHAHDSLREKISRRLSQDVTFEMTNGSLMTDVATSENECSVPKWLR